ncbi:MAG TPA: dCMP deaminase family protein [Longimicrobiales bacterium]|nr:dCMP deaminase family protein [Longimicrobiales bacterium]
MLTNPECHPEAGMPRMDSDLKSASYVRPDRMNYYMMIAMAVRRRANCIGNRVGALLILNDRIISTGYNGTPQNMPNCDEGGCERCANRAKYGTATSYDVCICVHAEQNALISASRFGTPVEGASLYTTMRPCFGCAKELLQARIHAVYYLHEWRHPDEDLWRQYLLLQQRFPGGVHRVDVADPDAVWALSARRDGEADTGHTL